VGSEAFLISENTIAAIPLSGLRRPDVEKNVKILAFNSNRRRRDASLRLDGEDGDDGDKIKNHDPKLHSALLNLWDYAVQPVLQALGLLRHDPKPKPLPRVRWVVSGISSLLRSTLQEHTLPGQLITLSVMLSLRILQVLWR
jgi:hypothetical protein